MFFVQLWMESGDASCIEKPDQSKRWPGFLFSLSGAQGLGLSSSLTARLVTNGRDDRSAGIIPVGNAIASLFSTS